MSSVSPTQVLSPAAREAAQAVLEQSIIEQTVPRPRLGDWWQELLGSLFAFLGSLFDLNSASVRTLMFTVAWAVIVVAAVAVVWLGWSWWRGRQVASEDELVVVTGAAVRTPLDERDRSDALAGALASGDVSAAVEAMWLLLATRVGRRAPAEDAMRRLVASKEWTPRLLLAEAGSLRGALTSPLRELERHTYGSTGVGIDQLRSLWERLEQIVPAPEASRGAS